VRQALSAAAFADAAQAAGVPSAAASQHSHTPRQNIAPAGTASVITAATEPTGDPDVSTMVFGLIPARSMSEPDHWRMFNARQETVDHLQSFAKLTERRRCVIPVDGWFEWMADEFKEVKRKQPYYVHEGGGGPLWLAGLYDRCVRPGHPDGALESFTIITCDSAERLAWLHNRMPVILDAAALKSWLADEPPAGGEAPLVALRRCAAAPPCSGLAWHAVTKKLTAPSYQESDVAEPVKLASQLQKSVASFFTRTPSKASAQASEAGGLSPPSAPSSASRAPKSRRESAAPSEGKMRSIASFFKKRPAECEAQAEAGSSDLVEGHDQKRRKSTVTRAEM